MRVFLIDPTSSFLDFAMRCEAQGHEVRIFVGPDKHGDRSPVGDGLINKVQDIQSGARWADLILASDNAKYIRDLEGLHKRGFPVFGPNAECTEWELDRSKGQQILMDAGIECLPCVEFTNYDVAKAHQLANRDVRYVSKPSADVDKALSYVSKSFKDMCFMLDYWKKHNKKKVPFIFQEFCPGIEMAVGGWMGRDGFLSHFLENFEFKKLMPGEKGPNTGEMGTLLKYSTIEDSKLAQEMLLPLESQLIRCGYTGFIDVAVMIGTEREREGKPNPMEFTTRHGWPLFQIQQALHPDVCGWMLDALEGRDTFRPYMDTAAGIVCAMPDFPYSHMTRKEVTGFPVWGVDASTRFNFHPCEMMLGESYGDSGKMEPMLVTAGDYVAVVTGTGRGVEKAKEAAYSNLNNFEIPNSPIFRTDIGCRLEKQLPILQSYGYASSWEW